MSAFISALTDSTTGITVSGLWSEVAAMVPFIVLIFGFAFGYKLLRRALKKGSQGKVGI